MAKEGYSILKNLAAMNKGYVPYWLLKKLEQLDKTGKFFTEEEIQENKKKELEFLHEVNNTPATEEEKKVFNKMKVPNKIDENVG